MKLAYQSRLVETRGTGIRLIYDSCKKAGLKKPTYHEEGDFVKLILYFEPAAEEYENEEDAIIAFIKINKIVVARQVADFLAVSRNTAIRKLTKLLKAKRIKSTGKGRAVKYHLI